MLFKISKRSADGFLPCFVRVGEAFVMDEVPEGRAAAVVVAGEAFGDEAACVDRFNIVFTETLGPIGAHRHQAGHQQTGDEAERHHGFLSVVDEQTEFVERSFLEHVWVRCTFHKRAQKKGVFESASWGSVDATMMKQATEIDRHDKDTVLAAGRLNRARQRCK